ncbi:MAG: helix-turn-helix domain-containing protein [Pseudomonadota bacterium]
MSVRLAHGGLPSDMTPHQLKRFLKRARVSLGLSKGAIEYLVFAIDNFQASDFAHGRICAIWHSLERLAQNFGLSKRQVGRIEAELIEAGLIRCTYPERKSRSGDRVGGVIKRAAGIRHLSRDCSLTRLRIERDGTKSILSVTILQKFSNLPWNSLRHLNQHFRRSIY